MGNPTSRQLQTLQPLSTFEFFPSVSGHDESVNDHALFTPLTLQIIMAIMVTFCALGTVVHSGTAQVSRRRTSDLLCSQYHHPLWHPPDCQPCVLCPCLLLATEIQQYFIQYPTQESQKKTISLLPVSRFYVWGEVWDLTISVFTFWVFMAGWLLIRYNSACFLLAEIEVISLLID